VSNAKNHTTRTLEERALLPELRGELYDAWHSACDQALMAYRVWSQAPDSDKQDAHVAYLAALDREEAAAEHIRCASRATAG
jgi:hypothetical protein